MILAALLLAFAAATIDLDVISLPLTADIRVALSPGGRAEMKREGTVTRMKIEIDRVAPPMALGPVYMTYVVWAVSPEGIVDNLGEMDMNGNRGQFVATTRLGQFALLITAEPHYMVDRPSAAVAYRSQAPKDEVRRRTVTLGVGDFDYSKLTPPADAANLHGSIVQARVAIQIAQSAGAERLAPAEYRNAQVALASAEELLTRNAPLEILWPAANEAIRWSQRAAMIARGK